MRNITLEADQGREDTGLVVRVRSLRLLLPRSPYQGKSLVGSENVLTGEGRPRHPHHPRPTRIGTRGSHLPAPASFRHKEFGIRCKNHWRDAEILRVIGDDEEVKRAVELGAQTARQFHRLALCETVPLVWARLWPPVPASRESRVWMCVSPQ